MTMTRRARVVQTFPGCQSTYFDEAHHFRGVQPSKNVQKHQKQTKTRDVVPPKKRGVGTKLPSKPVTKGQGPLLFENRTSSKHRIQSKKHFYYPLFMRSQQANSGFAKLKSKKLNGLSLTVKGWFRKRKLWTPKSFIVPKNTVKLHANQNRSHRTFLTISP